MTRRTRIVIFALYLAAWSLAAGEPLDAAIRAKEVCSEKAPDEQEDCSARLLEKWADPVEQAKVTAAQRAADGIGRACKQLDLTKFDACMGAKLFAYPPESRELIHALAFRISRLRSAKADEEAEARTIAACRRAGIEEGVARLGMTHETVRLCGWGIPDSINRTITSGRAREQWVYGDGQYLYFDGGKLTAIQDRR